MILLFAVNATSHSYMPVSMQHSLDTVTICLSVGASGPKQYKRGSSTNIKKVTFLHQVFLCIILANACLGFLSSQCNSKWCTMSKMSAESNGQVLAVLCKALVKHVQVTLWAVTSKCIQERQLKEKWSRENATGKVKALESNSQKEYKSPPHLLRLAKGRPRGISQLK